MADEIVTRTKRYWIDDDGIMRIRALPGAEETLADARENVRASNALAKGRRYPVLDDSRQLRSMDRAARAHYAGPESAGSTLAVASIIASPIQRTMGNFFLTLNKPPFPVRLFSAEAEALAWLKDFVK